MIDTINGRTPEEIKARIDYCRNVKTAGDCMSCPYVEDADVCASDFMFDSFDYMQQLERERDEARRDADKLKHATKEATDNYFVMLRERDELLQKNQQLERERDAAVERCVTADDVSNDYYYELKQLESAQPKWISVKDNPPDGTKDVIAYNAFGEMMIGRVYETSHGRYKCEDGYSEDMFSVTHWMSRPEPPKEE